jgi:nucleotide-binding universal stress UspA family protein
MATTVVSTISPESGVRATRSSPILVATDGRLQSDSALKMGRMLAESTDALRIATVLKALPVVSEATLSIAADIEAARRAAAETAVVEQMGRVGVDEQEFVIAEGDPASVVASIAHQAGATMIVCGLGSHRVTERVFGEETALRLMRVSDVPVLAVANAMNRAPRRIVVAVDFSETSLRATRLALDLASASATVYLAHVAPPDSSLYDWDRRGKSYRNNAGDALEKMREQLNVPTDMIAQNVLLKGDPATELLAFATSVNADLIATGSHGHGFVARMLIGSTTTKIVRCSTCSVLTVPHAAAMTRARTIAEPPVLMEPPHADWAGQLDAFTRRNIGRRGILEVDDPDIGAQAQVFDYPLLGATFDSHDQRAELMFGELGATNRHLTRSIGGVTAIDVLSNDHGRDLAIRIGHGKGQTLLTFST